MNNKLYIIKRLILIEGNFYMKYTVNCAAKAAKKVAKKKVAKKPAKKAAKKACK
jgi:hypothetical protein